MTLRTCPVPGCPALTHGGPCPTHLAASRRSRPTFPNRHRHRLTRARLLPAALGKPCPLGCGTIITPTNADLDHTHPRSLGNTAPGDRIICSGCNRAAGGRLGAAIRRGDDV